MSWVITGITVGAVGGGLGGYFGTSKKNKDQRGSNALKFALLGGGLGAGLGAGGAAMMGGGASAGASGATGLAGKAAMQPAMSLSGGGIGNAAGSPLMSMSGGSTPIASASANGGMMSKLGGFGKGLMYNDPNGNQIMQGGKAMLQQQLLGGLTGSNKNEQSVQSQSSIEPGEPYQTTAAPSIAFNNLSTSDKEKLMRYLNGVPQGGM